MSSVLGILLTPEAQANFQRVVKTVAQQESPLQARRVAQELREKVNSVARFPERYERFHAANTGRHKYRQFFALDYRIVYSIDEGRRSIVIHAFDRSLWR